MESQKDLYNQLNSDLSLDEIQDYIKRVIQIRGFHAQPVEQELLLLMEEVGELAKAVRKEKTDMGIDMKKIKNYESVENELADVFIVLISICNTLNVNLFEAFLQKENINKNRTWNHENKN